MENPSKKRKTENGETNVNKCFKKCMSSRRCIRYKEQIYNDSDSKVMWKLIFNEHGEPWFYELLAKKYIGGAIEYIHTVKHTFVIKE
jgi:hypothetical protein